MDACSGLLFYTEADFKLHHVSAFQRENDGGSIAALLKPCGGADCPGALVPGTRGDAAALLPAENKVLCVFSGEGHTLYNSVCKARVVNADPLGSGLRIALGDRRKRHAFKGGEGVGCLGDIAELRPRRNCRGLYDCALLEAYGAGVFQALSVGLGPIRGIVYLRALGGADLCFGRCLVCTRRGAENRRLCFEAEGQRQVFVRFGERVAPVFPALVSAAVMI